MSPPIRCEKTRAEVSSFHAAKRAQELHCIAKAAEATSEAARLQTARTTPPAPALTPPGSSDDGCSDNDGAGTVAVNVGAGASAGADGSIEEGTTADGTNGEEVDEEVTPVASEHTIPSTVTRAASTPADYNHGNHADQIKDIADAWFGRQSLPPSPPPNDNGALDERQQPGQQQPCQHHQEDEHHRGTSLHEVVPRPAASHNVNLGGTTSNNGCSDDGGASASTGVGVGATAFDAPAGSTGPRRERKWSTASPALRATSEEQRAALIYAERGSEDDGSDSNGSDGESVTVQITSHLAADR